MRKIVVAASPQSAVDPTEDVDNEKSREYIRSDVAGSRVELSGVFETKKPTIVMGHIVMENLPSDVIAPSDSEEYPVNTVVRKHHCYF